MRRAIALTGPTASGKSSLALELARRHRIFEIVSVDSMQVYRHMDIGTAKPTPAEQEEIPHHLIDLVEPEHNFTVVEYQAAFGRAIAEIERRGHLPLLVGGTGLYVRAVVDELTPPPQWPALRAELEAEPDPVALHARLRQLDPIGAARMEPTNRRRIVRALEVTLGSGRPFSSYGPGLTAYAPTPVVQFALARDRGELTERITTRYHAQMAGGFLAEVEALAPRALSRTARQALGYRELLAHLAGETALDQALELAIARTRRFAVRQERWFRRDPRVQWIAPEDFVPQAEEVLAAWSSCS